VGAVRTNAQATAQPTTAGSGAAEARGLEPPQTTPEPASPTDLAGIWQGTLTPPNAPKGQRVVIKVTKDAAGTYHAALYNADRGTPPLTFNSATVQGMDVKFTTPMMSIEGTLSADGKTIDAKWGIGGPNPLAISFARTAPDAAWPIPEPLKPMAADAKPVFDVVTVKPTPPGRPGKTIGFNGNHFLFRGANLNDMIALGYGLHTKQIVGEPDWAGKDLFDVEGTPDVPGIPNQKQIQSLLQNLLADRFQLKFHTEKRDLAVYVITVAPGGPKLTPTTAAPNDPSGMGFGGVGGSQGVTAVGRNLTMADFAMWFQSGVTDRPVVDLTEIKGRYDIRLKWTPDDSQFAQFGGSGFHVPPASDAADAPPNLYTAIQEQLGLKIEATKAPDDVMVIEHVEKPGAN
ncbi:MAG: TIGR03435 family protein, partial [Terracidiphilus sp.]